MSMRAWLALVLIAALSVFTYFVSSSNGRRDSPSEPRIPEDGASETTGATHVSAPLEVDDSSIDHAARTPGTVQLTLATSCDIKATFDVVLSGPEGTIESRNVGIGTSNWTVQTRSSCSFSIGAFGWVSQELRFSTSELGPSEPIEVIMRPLRLVRGQVVDAETWQALDVATITLETRIESGGVFGHQKHEPAELILQEGWYCTAQLEDVGAQSIRAYAQAASYEVCVTDWIPISSLIEMPPALLQRSRVKWVELTGRIYTAQGSVVAGGLVAAFPVTTAVEFQTTEPWSGAFNSNETAADLQSARTHATSRDDGTFTLQVRAGEEWRLSAWTEGHALTHGPVFWVPYEADTVSHDILLQNGARVRGIIYLTGSREIDPTVRALLVTTHGLTMQRAVHYGPSDREVLFDLGELPPSRYTFALLATRPGTESGNSVRVAVSKQVHEVYQSSTHDLIFDLTGLLDSPDLYGTLAIEPSFIDSAIIQVYSNGDLSTPAANTWPRRDGAFSISGLDPGSYELMMLASSVDGTRLMIHRTEIGPEQFGSPITLVPNRSVVRGVIAWDDPKRSRRVLVRFARLSSATGEDVLSRQWSVATRPDGQFEVIGLPFGSYHFETHDREYESTVLLADSHAELTIQLRTVSTTK